jgi:hypothetical protein
VLTELIEGIDLDWKQVGERVDWLDVQKARSLVVSKAVQMG